MLTKSLTSVLLLLSTDILTLPWGSPMWQTLTRMVGKPWAYDNQAEDKALSPNVKEWTIRLAKKIKAFVTTVCSLNREKCDKHVMKKTSNNDSAGCTAWSTFIMKKSGAWSLNKIIDQVLEENSHPSAAVYQVMGQKDISNHLDCRYCDLYWPTSDSATHREHTNLPASWQGRDSVVWWWHIHWWQHDAETWSQNIH